MQTPDTPRYRVPDDIAWIDGTEIGLGEELYLSQMPGGHTILLENTARMIWHIALTGSPVADQVAALVGLPPGTVGAEVERFLADLEAAGLLSSTHRRTAQRSSALTPVARPPRRPK